MWWELDTEHRELPKPAILEMATKIERCVLCNFKQRVQYEATCFCCRSCRTVIVIQPRPPLQMLQPLAVSKKRAVLCGISYNSHPKISLNGSTNSINYMKSFLLRKMRFPNECIIVLTEDEKDPTRIPTKFNIRAALFWLVQGCQPGDSLVFHYAGHASQVPDEDQDEVDGYDETLCPVDFETEGVILDDEINETIVRPLPRGAKLHAIIDTCFSGTFLDLSFMSRVVNRDLGLYKWEDHRARNVYKGTSGGIAVCFSACDDHETSGEFTAFNGSVVIGALTFSFIRTVEDEPQITYGRLLDAMRRKISDAQKQELLNDPFAFLPPQEPLLSSSEIFDIRSKAFMF